MSRKFSRRKNCSTIFARLFCACTRPCLDWERAGYERIHGRQSSNDLLNALLNDPQFAWLRPISQLIVRIDELLGDKTPPMRNDVDAVVSQVKALTSPNAEGNIYERRYDTVLQEHPDAVFAHRDVLKLLKRRAKNEKRIAKNE